MRKIIKQCSFVLLILTAQMLSSQNETTKWYFGLYAGLDFLTAPPTILTNGASANGEGCASMADAAGNLVCYTDGLTLYNKQHVVMANGSGLLGNASTTQPALIVKQPGLNNNYYVFTLDEICGSNGLRYSVADMNLAAGMGSVTTKNVLLNTPSTEKLAGVRHCNGVDVWILSHDCGSNNFRAYLLTATGINTTAVVSSIGSVLTSSSCVGQMKISPKGKKVGVANGGLNQAALFDFDNATGMLSNQLILSSNPGGQVYGCEFSADGSKFYTGVLTPGKVYQWNLSAGSNAAIVSSQTNVLPTGTLGVSGMQLAPNGKIYFMRGSYIQTLDVINNPNALGTACNFISQGQSIAPGQTSAALPNFVSSLLKDLFTYNQGSNCLTASFSSPTATNPASLAPPVSATAWSFGEPSSGAANSSTLSNPVHTYAAYGNYSVTLVVNYTSCAADTIKQVITIAGPTLSVLASPASCPGANSSTVIASGGSGQYSYLWAPSAQTSSVASNLSAGTQTVTVTDVGKQCSVSNTLQLSALPVPTIAVAGNFTICTAQTATLNASGASTYTWSNNANTQSISISPTITTTYTVLGTGSINACQATKIVTITVSKCLGIGQLQEDTNLLKIYPNPNSSKLIIESQEAGNLIIYNETGSIVMQEHIEASENTIDISKFKNGVYFVKFSTLKKETSLKIVKTD